MRYQDVDIRIEADPEGGFKTELRDSVSPPVTAPFKVPFPRRRLDRLPLLFERLRNAQKEGRPTRLTAEKVGQALFRSLFSGDVGRRFQERLAYVEGLGRDWGLRIRLSFDLDNPDLVAVAGLPWELIWDGSRNDFLCLIPKTPLARFLPVARQPLREFEGPLNVLIVQSVHTNIDPMDLKAEWEEIWKALSPQPGIKVDAIRHPSIEGLYQKLEEEPWHVLHFVGHGNFDAETGQGRLCFENPAGEAERIMGNMLAHNLKAIPNLDLRLVVLNACRSGAMPRHKGQDPFNSVAPALIQAGIPAVIAMQCPIWYDAAAAFGATFYRRIATGDPVDAAMVQGRLAILRTYPYDWGTPVLFTRVPDGDILGPVAKAPSPSSRMSRPLRLGVRTFSETPGRPLYGKEMEEECDDILDLRSLFTGSGGRYIKDPALWQAEIVPRLQEFLRPIPSKSRPVHLNFASHASIAFAAGYFLEAKSGVEVTIRQRGKAGTAEWRAFAGAERRGSLFLREKDVPKAESPRDVALSLSITHPILTHVQHYLKAAPLAVHRIAPVTLSPAPSLLGVRDGHHAFRLAEGIAHRLRERPSSESGGTVHLFAAAPNAMLFFLGQLCQGVGRIQLYEHDFFSGRTGDYSPSILLPPGEND